MPCPDPSARLPRAMRLRATVLAAAVLAVAGMSSASAAKVYRCGNTFQDQPCAEARPADTRPADRASVARAVVPDCNANARDGAGRDACVSMKLVRDNARTPPAAVKQ